MYQTDWGAKFVNDLHSELLSKSGIRRKNLNLAIASFLGLQISALAIVPMNSSAETQSMSAFQEDVPEEVLRVEIYTDARSPIDGKQLTAAEYAELMEKLRSLDGIPPEALVSPKIREVIDLLRLRKFLRQFIP